MLNVVSQGDKVQVLRYSEQIVGVNGIRNVSKPALSCDRLFRDIKSGHADGARGGPQNSRDRAECRGLAGAVGTDQANNLSRLYFKTQVLYGAEGAVVLAEALD